MFDYDTMTKTLDILLTIYQLCDDAKSMTHLYA